MCGHAIVHAVGGPPPGLHAYRVGIYGCWACNMSQEAHPRPACCDSWRPGRRGKFKPRPSLFISANIPHGTMPWSY